MFIWRTFPFLLLEIFSKIKNSNSVKDKRLKFQIEFFSSPGQSFFNIDFFFNLYSVVLSPTIISSFKKQKRKPLLRRNI